MNDTTAANAATNEAAAQAPAPTALNATGAVVNINEVFHFKKEKLRDSEGKVIGEGKKHPSVTLALPVPTLGTLAAFVAAPAKFAKELELIFSTVQDQVYRIARQQINDFREKNPEATVTSASLDYSKLDWTAIANMPKAERASSVPSDEDINAFLDSYKEVMPAALNKPQKNIDNHVLLFQSGFKKQRSQKEILEMFQNALTVYTATAGEAAVEEHGDVISYFSGKLERFLKTEEKITMDQL